MYNRLLALPKNKSVMLFGPRGTGKTTWVKSMLPDSIYIDLLKTNIYRRLLADPERLAEYIPDGYKDYVVLDEVQRVPELLNVVHRLIEEKKIKFVLTGSSARKLREGGHNLLAGRALVRNMYPLTAVELGKDFNLKLALKRGMLPMAQEKDELDYLESYVSVYLDQEVQREGLVRSLGDFYRFLEVASMSQGQQLNVSNVAREAGIGRTVIIGYFKILNDLLLSYSIPSFTKRAKRRLVSAPKFYFFDVGVYRTIRPVGPYDTTSEISGLCLESLVGQELLAQNDLGKWGYKIYYFRTASGVEVDFVLYGKKGIVGIEVKLSNKFQTSMLNGLKSFKKDYPEAKLYLFYGGKEKLYVDGVTILPVEDVLSDLSKILN